MKPRIQQLLPKPLTFTNARKEGYNQYPLDHPQIYQLVIYNNTEVEIKFGGNIIEPKTLYKIEENLINDNTTLIISIPNILVTEYKDLISVIQTHYIKPNTLIKIPKQNQYNHLFVITDLTTIK
jgi:hypothetical protein